MKKITLKLFILTLLTLNYTFAQNDSLLKFIAQANNAYNNKNYDSAIVLYNKVLNAGFHSPYLYYNLGNAYFRNNQLAKAIINYERAHKLAPNNPKIKYNLLFANQFVKTDLQTVNEFFLKRWWKKLALTLSPDTWAVISLTTFALMFIFAFIFLFSKKISLRKIGFYLAVLFLIFSLSSFSLALKNKNDIINSNTAIIINKTVLRSSPSNEGTELYILSEGVKIKILSKNDGWYEVKLPNGSIGWLKKSDLEII